MLRSLWRSSSLKNEQTKHHAGSDKNTVDYSSLRTLDKPFRTHCQMTPAILAAVSFPT